MDCAVCGLISAHRDDLPAAEEERARYETHRNDPGDPGYRAFLDRVVVPLVARLEAGAEGLDYGCGPGPALSVMMSERGFPMEVWDPFFAPDPAVLNGVYDFVTCTETVEHFHRPAEDYRRLAGLVRPGGWLAIMTEPVPRDIDLDGWWYARDFTHVALHRERTLGWLEDRWGWSLERPSRTVALFRRPSVDQGEGGAGAGSSGG